jgi:hypothetical protein
MQEGQEGAKPLNDELARESRVRPESGPGTASIGRHADAASASPDELVRRWLRQGKIWLLPLLLSDYGRELIKRKYDALATDRAYENRPSGRLGPIGKLIDWIVLQQDIHAGLRQRLPLVVDEVSKGVTEAWARGLPSVRLVSGPCGLARDLRRAWWSLGAPTGRLELLGLDLDSSDEVLPAAARLAQAEAVPLQTSRCDLLDHTALAAAVGQPPADVFLCIGLGVWLDPPDLAHLLKGIHQNLTQDGLLIVDNFRAHGASRFAADLEMKTRYHSDVDFERALRESGFAVEVMHETENRVNVVYRCRKADR